MSELLTVGDVRAELEGIPDDEAVCVVRGGALGEATGVYRNAEGVVIEGR